MKNKIPQFLNSSIPKLLNSSILFNSIIQLDVQAAYCVLAASAFMGRLKIPGAEQHSLFNRLAGAGVQTENDLRAWMQESFPALNVSLWENCRKQADEFLETGIKVFRWENSPHFVKEGRGDSENSTPESAKDFPPFVKGGRGDFRFFHSPFTIHYSLFIAHCSLIAERCRGRSSSSHREDKNEIQRIAG